MMGSLIYEPSKLYQTLKTLHIETGKLGNNEISAWHDTFKQTQQKFLDWFENAITIDNCASYSATEAHQELLQKDLFSEGSQHKQKLAKCELAYPDLFEEDTNEFDCEFLQSECEYYEDELKHLEKLITKGLHHSKKAKHQQNTVLHELMDADFSKDGAASQCLELAKVFDQLNAELAEKVLTSCNLIRAQDNCSSRFLCEIDMESNSLLLNKLEIIDKFSSDLEKHENLDGSFNTTIVSNASVEGSFAVSDWEKTVYTDPVYDKSFDMMTLQLIKALNRQSLNLAWVKVYNLQLKWLPQITKVGLLKQRQNKPEQLLATLRQKNEELLSSNVRIIRNLIGRLMMSHTGEELAGLELKIQISTKIEMKLDNLLQYQSLMTQFLLIEIGNFDTFADFLNNMRTYTTELQRCVERIEAMKSVISDYNVYVAKPIEEKWHLLANVLQIIGVEQNVTFVEALQAVQTFEDKCDALESKIFIGDIEAMATELDKLDKSNKIMVNFLSNKATDTINVIPNDIYYALKNSVDSISEYNKFIKYSQNIPKEMSCKFENNKWLKIKRQLWMYFLRKPEKVENIIEEIGEFVRKKRAAYLNSEI